MVIEVIDIVMIGLGSFGMVIGVWAILEQYYRSTS